MSHILTSWGIRLLAGSSIVDGRHISVQGPLRPTIILLIFLGVIGVNLEHSGIWYFAEVARLCCAVVGCLCCMVVENRVCVLWILVARGFPIMGRVSRAKFRYRVFGIGFYTVLTDLMRLGRLHWLRHVLRVARKGVPSRSLISVPVRMKKSMEVSRLRGSVKCARWTLLK